MSDPNRFREVDAEMFLAAWEKAVRAVKERPPLTQAEQEAGWQEDPGGSGLRRILTPASWTTPASSICNRADRRSEATGLTLVYDEVALPLRRRATQS
jgi:hypothetical protein